MKRLSQFLCVFFIILIAAYLQPVYFPHPDGKVSQVKNSETKKVSPVALNYSEVTSSGFATFIGKSKEELIASFGEPEKKEPSGLGYTWWIYYKKGTAGYFQVSIQQDIVLSIFSLGKDDQTAPFKTNMNLVEVTDLADIQSIFSFDYENRTYAFELTEEDMNYRPLIAFDNGTFAILHFSQKNGKLLAIRYLDKKSLLQLMPYQLNEGEVSAISFSGKEDWETIDQSNQGQFLTILNYIREMEKLPKYDLSQSLSETAQIDLQKFIQNPEDTLTSKIRGAEWLDRQEKLSFAQPFIFSSDEMKKLVSDEQLDPAKIHGIFQTPSLDVPWLLGNWYGDQVIQPQLSKKTDRTAGIGFSKDKLLFLLSKDDEKSAESTEESSGK